MAPLENCLTVGAALPVAEAEAPEEVAEPEALLVEEGFAEPEELAEALAEAVACPEVAVVVTATVEDAVAAESVEIGKTRVPVLPPRYVLPAEAGVSCPDSSSKEQA